MVPWTQEQEAVRTVARNPCAWPGGYPVGLVMSDGEVLCPKCVKDNYRLILMETIDYSSTTGWRAAGHRVFEGTFEDHGPVACCNCPTVLVEPGPEVPENTRDNREDCALTHAENLAHGDLVSLAQSALMEQYESDQDYFEDSWRNYKGDNDE